MAILSGLFGPKKDQRRQIHFLHIGKNAGTHIKAISRRISANSQVIKIVGHKHRIWLRDLPRNEPYFFSIRNPEKRFVSGFYSRKRKGQPRRLVEWTTFEDKAFSTFDHANDLAEALFQPGEAGALAMAAIKSISHCAMDQIDWFTNAGYFLEVRPPLAILRQEALEADLKYLFQKLDIKQDYTLEVAGKSHANSYEDIPPLSDPARQNLLRWYAQDIEFYRVCDEWINRQQSR